MWVSAMKVQTALLRASQMLGQSIEAAQRGEGFSLRGPQTADGKAAILRGSMASRSAQPADRHQGHRAHVSMGRRLHFDGEFFEQISYFFLGGGKEKGGKDIMLCLV